MLQRIRRTRLAGNTFLLIAFLTLLAAWNTGTNLLYVIAGGLASFPIISAVSVGWGLRGLRVTRDVPTAAHRGEPVGITLRVENHKRFMPTFLLRIDSRASVGAAATFLPQVPARRAAVVRMSAVFERRGVYTLPPIELTSLFPFGLVSKRQTGAGSAEIVVYPRVRAVRSSALAQLPNAQAARVVRTGDGDEFFSLREYVRGDDPRRIAWRASARAGKFLVRELSQGASRFVVLVLDTQRPQAPEDFDERFEEAVELTASLAVTLLNQHYTVALATGTARVPEGKGQAQATRILDCLARVQPTDKALPDAVERFAATHAADARIVFLTADATKWGGASPFAHSRFIDPHEVTYA
ncbi:MAG TPA: DUF58 domain-containing protein [Candidatus Hydrogenedentes bacterium]|nr:DUF58 domain-containing protein [Candidatus Hydrogenedentota bacterium]HPG68038.1 DUF58 domain-containing protein [Candidatus Hydrogenedentota bacterium]